MRCWRGEVRGVRDLARSVRLLLTFVIHPELGVPHTGAAERAEEVSVEEMRHGVRHERVGLTDSDAGAEAGVRFHAALYTVP